MTRERDDPLARRGRGAEGPDEDLEQCLGAAVRGRPTTAYEYMSVSLALYQETPVVIHQRNGKPQSLLDQLANAREA